VRRAVVVLLLAAACPAPRDATPLVYVDPNGARRARALLGPHETRASETPAPARVHVMAPGEELGGPNAIGRPGDLLLENSEVAFVIDRLGSSAGFAESGGNVVDAADARTRKDELGQQFTYFGTFPRQGVYDAIASGASTDGSAWVEARGRELYEPGLVVVTRYTLRAPDRALLLETTLENTGAAPVEGLTLGDAIQWGGAEKIAPGKARGFKGPSSGPYVGGVGRFISYAITSTGGTIDGVSGSTWTDTAQGAKVTLRPGEKVSYARLLLVGERADSAGLVSELARAAGQAVGTVRVTLRSDPAESDGGAGGDVGVPPDARLSVRDAGSGVEVMSIHAAGDPPALGADLPPGHWQLAYAGGGGRAAAAPVMVDVAAGGETSAALIVSRPAGARVRCLDAAGATAPCKVTFERLDGGPAPDFGPAYAAGPARNQATTVDGTVDVALAAGSYRVTASRGPAYALAQSELRLEPGDTKSVDLSLRRVLDTAGYLGCDFHQHTMLGADAPVAVRDRVIANAAEGVDVAVASEHNVVADLEPMVRELGLERDLVSIPGDELTSDASRHPWGHANAYPLALDPAQARGGAPAVRDRTAREVFDEIRAAAAGGVVIQINHPRAGRNGYFDQLGFDPARGEGTAPGYDARFDALEVWNGRNVDARGKVLADFFALLRTRHPVTATADTDTHGIVGQEAGYPRTFVRVHDDGPRSEWDAARTADVVHGVKTLRDVVLTNGPMLRVSAEGVPVGGVVRGRVAHVKVHVESAPWVVVDTVRILRASDPDAKDDADVRRVAGALNQRGALGADVAFTVRAKADDAFVVLATGSKTMTPVLGEGADPAETMPWAMTGAIWIDADGDGKSLGR
jgi:hypothetical protein